MNSNINESHRIIDSRNAKSLARRFLERHHTLIIFKNAILEGKTWNVIMDVGYKDENIIHIKIDAETGKILSHS